jgi:hypothetical protein
LIALKITVAAPMSSASVIALTAVAGVRAKPPQSVADVDDQRLEGASNRRRARAPA